MDGADVFTKGLEQATLVVKQVRPEHFANATPDTDWNTRDLVAHMLYELTWVPDLVAGKTIEDVGTVYDGDLVGDDDVELSANWQNAVDRADTAVVAADPEETAHLSYAEVSVDEYLYDAGTDQLIHAWDLGKAIGFPVHFDVAVAQEVYNHVLPNVQKMQQSGLFAPPLEVAEDADLQTKLLALFGRDTQWEASSI